MTKAELQQDLWDVKVLYFAGASQSLGNWNRFNVFYLKDGELVKIYIDETKDYPQDWNPIHYTRNKNRVGGYFYTCALGTDRVFQIAYSLSRWLFNGDGYHFQTRFLSNY